MIGSQNSQKGGRLCSIKKGSLRTLNISKRNDLRSFDFIVFAVFIGILATLACYGYGVENHISKLPPSLREIDDLVALITFAFARELFDGSNLAGILASCIVMSIDRRTGYHRRF